MFGINWWHFGPILKFGWDESHLVHHHWHFKIRYSRVLYHISRNVVVIALSHHTACQPNSWNKGAVPNKKAKIVWGMNSVRHCNFTPERDLGPDDFRFVPLTNGSVGRGMAPNGLRQEKLSTFPRMQRIKHSVSVTLILRPGPWSAFKDDEKSKQLWIHIQIYVRPLRKMMHTIDRALWNYKSMFPWMQRIKHCVSVTLILHPGPSPAFKVDEK